MAGVAVLRRGGVIEVIRARKTGASGFAGSVLEVRYIDVDRAVRIEPATEPGGLVLAPAVRAGGDGVLGPFDRALDVELSTRGNVWGGAEIRREAKEGIDDDKRLAALEGRGIGVALGERERVAFDGALDLELTAELAVETEFERGMVREKRVEVSDGVFVDGFGGMAAVCLVQTGKEMRNASKGVSTTVVSVVMQGNLFD